MRFYAARFPPVDVDSTYYRPLTEGRAALWAERPPEGFRFNEAIEEAWRRFHDALEPLRAAAS